MTAPIVENAPQGGSDPLQERGAVRRLFDLALPMIGINVLAVTTLAVDTIMCGRLPDSENVLAALGYSTQLVFFLMIIIIGLSVGTVALVSRAFGAKDYERVEQVVAQSTVLAVACGLGIAVLGNLGAPYILRALGASGPVVALGMDYLRPLLTFAVSYYVMLLFSAILRGVGNTRLPFTIALLTNGVNVFLDYGLILGNMGMPALGVRGAAIGTVIAYSLNVVLTLAVLNRGAIEGLRARIASTLAKNGLFDGKLIANLVRIGAPAALDMLILNVAFLAVIGMLGRIDQIAVAAHGVGLRIQSLAFVPGLAIAQATGALVGQALGASDVDAARATTRASVVLCVVVMSSLGFFIHLGAYPIVALFDIQPGTLLEGYAIDWIYILGYCMLPVGFHIGFVGMLQGSGATSTSLVINIVGTLLIQVPVAWLLGFELDLGPVGIWWSFPIAAACRGSMGFFAYKRGKWAKVGTDV